MRPFTFDRQHIGDMADMLNMKFAFDKNTAFQGLKEETVRDLYNWLREQERDSPAVAGETTKEQLTVQLAGCLTAAEGGTGESVVAQQGVYGWSIAYQRVLELRRKFDSLVEEIDGLKESWNDDAANHDGVGESASAVAATYRECADEIAAVIDRLTSAASPAPTTAAQSAEEGRAA